MQLQTWHFKTFKDIFPLDSHSSEPQDWLRNKHCGPLCSAKQCQAQRGQRFWKAARTQANLPSCKMILSSHGFRHYIAHCAVLNTFQTHPGIHDTDHCWQDILGLLYSHLFLILFCKHLLFATVGGRIPGCQ